MGDRTGISWTDATWNPVRGCSRVSPGCVNCYAEEVAARFSGPGQPYEGLAKRVGGDARWTGKVRMVPEHLADPLRWKRPRRIFVNSMSDLFHEGLSDQDIVDVFGIMALAHWHTFQVLTKRPERMASFLSAGDHGIVRQFSQIQANGGVATREVFQALDIRRRDGIGWQWPLPNVWLGVSAEDQERAEERIPLLFQCPAAVRFVSYEPALGPVDFTRLKAGPFNALDALRAGSRGWPGPKDYVGHSDIEPIDWIIVGGESGRDHRPCDPAWFEAVAEQCSAAGVALFVKQDSGPRPGLQGRLSDALWARKEFPRVA